MDIDSTTRKLDRDMRYYATTYKTPLLIAFTVVLSIVGFIFAVQLSLPGEALYTIKVNTFENGVEALHLSVKDKAQYQITLMQHRLAEVKTLSTKANVSEKAITEFIDQTTKHTNTFDALIAKSIDSAFSKTDVLHTINEFSSVTSAIEAVSENNLKLISIGDSVEENRQDMVRLYKDKVTSFVQTETQQTTVEYLKAELTEVKNGLSDKNLSKKTVNLVENYLDRITGALAKNSLDRAIIAAGEAQRFIKMEKYSGVIIVPIFETDEITASTSETIGTTSIQQTTSTTVITQ